MKVAPTIDDVPEYLYKELNDSMRRHSTLEKSPGFKKYYPCVFV